VKFDPVKGIQLGSHLPVLFVGACIQQWLLPYSKLRKWQSARLQACIHASRLAVESVSGAAAASALTSKLRLHGNHQLASVMTVNSGRQLLEASAPGAEIDTGWYGLLLPP
jgi:hypothetical protein